MYIIIDVRMRHLNSIVIPKIAADWRVVADHLDYHPSTIKVIDQRWRGDPIQCCQDLFRNWLGTDHKDGIRNWTTLLSTLKQVRQLRAVTEEIEKELTELKLYVTSIMCVS